MAHSQSQPATSAAEDRPSQRWLPLPTGNEADLRQQAALLRQLRELADFNATEFPKTPLTDQQLDQMERAFEALRGQLGDVQLPSLENIPPEWIDQALTDPNVQQRAQRLLEQYARDRKLPSADSARSRSDSTSIPLPLGSSADRNATGGRASIPRLPPNPSTPAQAASVQEPGQPTTARSAGGQADGTYAADPTKKPQLPNQADAQQLQALKSLFEKLAANSSRQGSTVSPANAAVSTPRTSSPRTSSLPRNNDDKIADKTDTRRGPNSGGTSTAEAPYRSESLPPRNGRSSAVSPPANRGSQASQNFPQFAPEGKGTDGTRPPSVPELADDSSAASQSITRPSSRQPSGQEPQGQTAPVPPDRSRRASTTGRPSSNSTGTTPVPQANEAGAPTNARSNLKQGSQETNNSRSGSTQSSSSQSDTSQKVDQELDVKRLVERQGLGGALRRIVEKALKEQASASTRVASNVTTTAEKSLVDPRAKSPTTKSAVKSAAQASPTTRSNTKSPQAQSASQLSSGKVAQPQSSGSATGGSKTSSQTARSQGKSTSDEFMEVVADIWRAVSTVPSVDGASAVGASSAAENSSSTATKVVFQWSRLAWAAAALAATLGLLYWLAQRRAKQGDRVAQEDAHWAREILKTGIRTRADVVRAFHSFVRQRPQAVPDWRTHRFVADRLCDASPHLQTVILELTSLYEQARYLPPEEQLSDEQIMRVDAALKQCDACPV